MEGRGEKTMMENRKEERKKYKVVFINDEPVGKRVK